MSTFQADKDFFDSLLVFQNLDSYLEEKVIDLLKRHFEVPEEWNRDEKEEINTLSGERAKEVVINTHNVKFFLLFCDYLENCPHIKSSLIDAFLAVASRLFDFEYLGFSDAERAKRTYMPILSNKILKVLNRLSKDKLNSSFVQNFIRDSEFEINMRERINKLI